MPHYHYSTARSAWDTGGSASQRLGFEAPANPLSDLLKQLQQSQAKANKANEQRYQQILGTFTNLGQAGTQRIAQQEQQNVAQGQQDLTSRGLGNTTLQMAVSRGAASDAELARQQLQESIALQKAGVMERRTDQGPDLSMFANLIAQAQQAQTPKLRLTSIAPIPSQSGGGFNKSYSS